MKGKEREREREREKKKKKKREMNEFFFWKVCKKEKLAPSRFTFFDRRGRKKTPSVIRALFLSLSLPSAASASSSEKEI